MDTVTCSNCNQDVVPRAPTRSYYWLIATFWVFSLLFGIGAAISPGWSLSLLVAWLFLACAVGVVTRRSIWSSCPECGAGVPPSTAEPSTSGVV